MEEVDGPENSKTPLWAWVVTIGIVVGASALFWVACIDTSDDGSFSASVTDSALSSGGRWLLDLEITNTGGDAGDPMCTVTAYDGDGVSLAVDGGRFDSIDPGERAHVRLLTGLKPESDSVARWEVECS